LLASKRISPARKGLIDELCFATSIDRAGDYDQDERVEPGVVQARNRAELLKIRKHPCKSAGPLLSIATGAVAHGSGAMMCGRRDFHD
jgi:hypothetical protein